MSTKTVAGSTTPIELLETTYEILKEKKVATKHMNLVASDTAKMQKIEKPVLIRCKDYLHYRGAGWEGNDPLTRHPDEKFPDRVTPTMRKFLQIIDDLYAVGKQDMLDVYFDALKNHGVEIKVLNRQPRVNDVDETWAAVENMSSFQTTICELADEINFGATQIAEDINFTPKKEFKGALSLYEKKVDEKDCDDMYQDKVTDLSMTEQAWNNIYDENL